jgi:chromosome segregation ATPase
VLEEERVELDQELVKGRSTVDALQQELQGLRDEAVALEREKQMALSSIDARQREVQKKPESRRKKADFDRFVCKLAISSWQTNAEDFCPSKTSPH